MTRREYMARRAGSSRNLDLQTHSERTVEYESNNHNQSYMAAHYAPATQVRQWAVI